MFTICFLTLFHANAIGNDDFILQADSEEHVKDIDEVDSVPMTQDSVGQRNLQYQKALKSIRP